METNWAAEHLQTIRTLMERSALYRRALAPIFTFVGVVGIAAAVGGWALKITSTRNFAIYWMAVSLIVIAGVLLLVRRQALKQAENFWSPPTRRIAQALLPALFVGFVLGTTVAFSTPQNDDFMLYTQELVVVWALLYGLALHSAGFFVPRGVKLFGWGFILAGLGLMGVVILVVDDTFSFTPPLERNLIPHWLMGAMFGVSHLACGIYLYFTEQRKNEA